MKQIHIFGGGTVAHISNHLALCAPARGNTARELNRLVLARFPDAECNLHLTKMAGGSVLETNEDIAEYIEIMKKDNCTKVVFFSCAMVDYQPAYLEEYGDRDTADPYMKILASKFGRYEPRLDTREHPEVDLTLCRTKKIISTIRQGRKDIFLVGFKATCGATKQEMYLKGLRLCKEASCNLVLVNDTSTKWNMIITPEEAAYHETNDRDEVLKQLVDMTWYRSQLTFTQSTVVDGRPVPWSSKLVPDSLRQVVNHCIKEGAYKEFNHATVGHFAFKISDTEFLTSIRKSNFNDLDKNGLVYVKTDGPDTVCAYGAKPSVGGQSQRIVFNDHLGMDCIVHFHSPLRPPRQDAIPVVSQREVECGSHQCGKNTSNNLAPFGNLKAVMLDQHGPNIVFNRNIDPQEVIRFIDANFDLTKKTGGYQL